MGNSYSHTNLRSYCTSFISGGPGAAVRWGDSIRFEMSEFGKSGESSRWGLVYIFGQKMCMFSLDIDSNRNGVERVRFDFSDEADNNRTDVVLEIERDGSGGLSCERTMVPGPQLTTTKSYQNCLIETTLLSYGCSQREGLLVVETRWNINDGNACMVTLAQYYVIQDLGLYVMAKICTNKGDGSGVEVKGPYVHSGKNLREVIVQTCCSREWTPPACPHCCCPTPPRDLMDDVARVLRRFPNVDSSNQSSNPAGDQESTSHISYPSIVKVQNITGLVNNTGYTYGNLNNSIINVKNLHVWLFALVILSCCFVVI